MDAALRLLEYRGRSLQEMGRRLKRKGFSDAVVTQTVNRLQELGLLNDVRFAEAVARERLEHGYKGKRQIYADLRRKGIAKPIIEAVLAEAGDEQQAAITLVNKVASRYAQLEPKTRYRRLHDLLLRRGFSPETASQVLAAYEAEAARTREE